MSSPRPITNLTRLRDDLQLPVGVAAIQDDAFGLTAEHGERLPEPFRRDRAGPPPASSTRMMALADVAVEMDDPRSILEQGPADVLVRRRPADKTGGRHPRRTGRWRPRPGPPDSSGGRRTWPPARRVRSRSSSALAFGPHLGNRLGRTRRPALPARFPDRRRDDAGTRRSPIHRPEVPITSLARLMPAATSLNASVPVGPGRDGLPVPRQGLQFPEWRPVPVAWAEYDRDQSRLIAIVFVRSPS